MSNIWSKLVNLGGLITGTLPVANGGTGLTSGTSGGVLAFTASGTLASSGALTQHGVVVGGGAGAAPTAVAVGTNGQLLVGATGADPAFGNTVSAVTTFSSGVKVSSSTPGNDTLSRFVTGTNNAYASGDYTTSTGTWTVESGDLKQYAYTVVGNVMSVIFSIEDSTFSSTPTEAYIALPSGYSVASGVKSVMVLDCKVGGNDTSVGRCRVVTGANQIVLFRSDGGTFSGTNNNNFRGMIAFLVS